MRSQTYRISSFREGWIL